MRAHALWKLSSSISIVGGNFFSFTLSTSFVILPFLALQTYHIKNKKATPFQNLQRKMLVKNNPKRFKIFLYQQTVL